MAENPNPPRFSLGEDDDDEQPGLSLGDMVDAVRSRWLLLTAGPLAAGLLSVGVTALIAPTFTARTMILPPQAAQGAAAGALASLGSLAGLAGGMAGFSTTGERYVALLQSVTLSDRIIDQFKLQEVYESNFKTDARKDLSGNVRITLGKKDGMIVVEVDDMSPQRAADMANRYVDELRRMSAGLAVTEAQQRRAFFERQLAESRDRLVNAQQALQASGFNAGALKAEPKAAAESYARLKAEATSAEVRLQALRSSLADDTPEIRQQRSTLAALKAQLALAEQSVDNTGSPDYIGKYREFKYQETLFELYARQFELARADESREGALIQVVDTALVPEKKTKPKRAIIAIVTTLAAGALLLGWVLLRRRAQLLADWRSNPG